MKNISITERFALFVIKEKGKLYYNSYLPYVCVSMAIEMILDGTLIITSENKKKKKLINFSNNTPKSKYNKELYNICMRLKEKSRNKELPLKKVIEHLCFSLSGKYLKPIISALQDEMLTNQLITLKDKKGVFGTKKAICLEDAKFNNYVEEFRNDFLNKESLEDNVILLASLLKSTDLIKNIFTKYEKEAFKAKLNEINNSEISQLVRISEDIVEEITAMIIIVAASN